MSGDGTEHRDKTFVGWVKRRIFGTAVGLHKLFLQPWLDAQGNGSIPAVLSGMLGFAISYRLVRFPSEPGWPIAWIVFSCFVGVAIYEAAMTVARLNPERLLEIVTSKMGVGNVGNPMGPQPHEWADPDKPRENLG